MLPESLTLLRTRIQRTMSITKMTRAATAAMAEKRAMRMVAIRLAAKIPIRPKMKARRATPPAMGWMMRALVRRWRATSFERLGLGVSSGGQV
jgi:hypothetical protein